MDPLKSVPFSVRPLQVACDPVQYDEVVQGLLTGRALTLPRTSLASIWSGITNYTVVAGHTSNH